MFQLKPKTFLPPAPSSDPLIPFVTDPDAVNMLDGKPYTSGASSDVQNTWRRFGWKPLAERLAESK